MTDTLDTSYIVGEEFSIDDDITIKLLYKDNKEEIYIISKDMIEIGKIDNYIVGTQKVDVKINYKDETYNSSLNLTFTLPNEVANIVTLIESLPELDDLNFTYEDELAKINEEYLALQYVYRSYVSNYQKYLDSEEKMFDLIKKHITADVVNQRFISKLGLDNLILTLNRNDYYEEDWKKILEIYEECLQKIYLNKNYQNIKDITNKGIKEINNIKTIELINFDVQKREKVATLKSYRNNLPASHYSQENWILLDSIVKNFEDKLEGIVEKEIVDELYNEALVKLNDVKTKDEEKILLIRYIIESKSKELDKEFRSINLDNYSSINRVTIVAHYNNSLNYINSCLEEESMNQEIKKFKFLVSKVKTIIQEEKIELNKNKKNIIDELNNFYSQINLHKYDTQNRNAIAKTIEETIEKINISDSIHDIILFKNEAINKIANLKTLHEIAIENLGLRIKKVNEELDTYIASLHPNSYSNDNWNKIIDIVAEAKSFFEMYIIVSTYNSEIEEKMDAYKSKIDSIMTIVEENMQILSECKKETINTLINYYNALDVSDFGEDFTFVERRLNDAINGVNKLDNIQGIVKLAEDTIVAIEAAKK